MKVDIKISNDKKTLTVMYSELNPTEQCVVEYIRNPNFHSLKHQQLNVKFKDYMSKLLTKIWRQI